MDKMIVYVVCKQYQEILELFESREGAEKYIIDNNLQKEGVEIILWEIERD